MKNYCIKNNKVNTKESETQQPQTIREALKLREQEQKQQKPRIIQPPLPRNPPPNNNQQTKTKKAIERVKKVNKLIRRTKQNPKETIPSAPKEELKQTKSKLLMLQESKEDEK